jgi:predicted ester cyclase
MPGLEKTKKIPARRRTSMTLANTNNLKEILARFIEEVWNAGDIDASDKYIAAKYTIHHDPGDPWEKRELDLAGYKERLRISRAPFPDQRFNIQDLVVEGNTAIMTWLWSATHKGDIPGFAATGNNIKMSGATVYYFDGGRLTGHWQIADRLGVFMQLRQGSATTADR